MAREPAKERGGKNSIANLLGRGCSFDQIDAIRAEIERDDLANDRRKWAGDPKTAPKRTVGRDEGETDAG
jgi:hypothetical protein